MNKQQLASTIWESANQMRSKIEANEYKDFILGFIFYKYLSEKQVALMKSEGFTDEKIKLVDENDTDYAAYVRRELGYFISYKNLFSTWLAKGSDFDVSDVTDALNAFNNNIDPLYKKVYEKIFNTLQTGLSKLGDTNQARTKSIRSLLKLIRKIPMDGKQDYDVLGFIYEYLISMFAANAGKKAGEFYTPHEVSVLMSEIVADHLKDREQIKIYDPTSGSGSLLINIGHSVAKYMSGEGKIEYYAQELKENTYNLTRMNLVMRGIKPANIFVRNGDTLEDDWPFFEENDRENSYQLVKVDAVVSNPPYSQKWDVTNKEFDPRYKEYGIAPKSKADYAFLLHDLYHLEDDGIMTIVLPHGVLFRGGEEGNIRKNLIEKNRIDAIIGLPANVFFGTGIPTIIMVLKKNRPSTDVLIVDASKGFVKEGKNNKLRACDIKKIADTVRTRTTIEKYSALVSKATIIENEYSLNIPRYVDSSDDAEIWDIRATMFGGIPEYEIDELMPFWNAFPGMKEDIFGAVSPGYFEKKCGDIKKTVLKHTATQLYRKSFEQTFDGLYELLREDLIDDILDISSEAEKEKVCREIFERLKKVPLVDKYSAYQILADNWSVIATDLEMIQTEGFEAITQVDPNMVLKKKDANDEEVPEVQEGWKGRVLPFELVQKVILHDEFNELKLLEERIEEIINAYAEIIDSLEPEEKESSVLNDTNDAFVSKELKSAVADILSEIESTEIVALKEYLSLSKKKDKLDFMGKCHNVQWELIEKSNDGTCKKGAINSRIRELQLLHKFPEDSFESKLVLVLKLMDEESQLKKILKQKSEELQLKTREMITNLDEDTALLLVEYKWIKPLVESLNRIPDAVIQEYIAKIEYISDKYGNTLNNIEEDVKKASKELSVMINELVGNTADMEGLAELRKILEV